MKKDYKLIKIIFIIIVFTSLVFSSATIISDSKQKISFNSEPEGVSVKLDNKILCITPCVVVLDKHQGQVILFEKDGYKSREIIMSESINYLTLLGGIFGSSTDASTGALWQYSPDNYYIELKKK